MNAPPPTGKHGQDVGRGWTLSRRRDIVQSMALLDLWLKSPEQVKGKHVQQLIAFAGDGKLLDGGGGSAEFRGFLSNVPSSLLARYAGECLQDAFTSSGLALQDIVNQVGERLGGRVISGRYRGGSGHIAHDGLWSFPDGHSVVVEVKTTDAYRIDLDKLASYRKALIEKGEVETDHSSVLIVVGRQDTGDLEAQIRGSRHAWDMRIISVDALLALLAIKESVEDPRIVQRIHQILAPREFTRLDAIVDVVFSTAEEIKHEEEADKGEGASSKPPEPRFVPAAFHAACIARVATHLGKNLVRRSRARYSTPDGRVAATCAVSKEYNPDTQPNYWFAFLHHSREFLESAEEAWVAFGCASERQLLLVPYQTFVEWLDGMWTTQNDDRTYWHVVVYREGERFVLHRKKGEGQIDVTEYLLPTPA